MSVKNTNGIISNHILIEATMISTLEVQKEEEEDLNLMTDTIRTNMVHQEVTTCHHMVSILTIMVHNKTTQETIKEVVKATIEIMMATKEIMKATIEITKETIEAMTIERA